MAAAKKKSEDKSLSILRELITHNGNKYCFDCSQRGPTYVNMTIGSFICSKCSGEDSHLLTTQCSCLFCRRGLTPPHRVKSISMATFTPEEIEQIKTQGNDYCKTIWMGLYEGSLPPLKDEQSIRDHMSEKYEKKRYYLDPSFVKKQTKQIEKTDFSTNNKNLPKDNGIWNSTSAGVNIARPTATKLPAPSQNTNVFNSVQLLSTAFATNNQPLTQPCPEFPVDFSSADIFNSSQMNNNFPTPTIPSSAPNNFDVKNSNTVSQDRYAALADLDFALRQQNQVQAPVENVQIPANPFDVNSFADVPSKNPFCTNANVNGNSYMSSNPFSVGYNIPQMGQSKNPFL